MWIYRVLTEYGHRKVVRAATHNEQADIKNSTAFLLADCEVNCHKIISYRGRLRRNCDRLSWPSLHSLIENHPLPPTSKWFDRNTICIADNGSQYLCRCSGCLLDQLHLLYWAFKWVHQKFTGPKNQSGHWGPIDACLPNGYKVKSGCRAICKGVLKTSRLIFEGNFSPGAYNCTCYRYSIYFFGIYLYY